MSLRADFHDAFDELAPSPPGLSDRIVETVFDGSAEKRRYRALSRFRVPLSLVAVLLLVALVVGALMGGRLADDWRNFVNRTHPAGINPAQLHQLELRPLRLPRFTSLEQCPTGPWDPNTGWLGRGPVYGAGGTGELLTWGRPEVTDWGFYFTVSFKSAPGLEGPLLIRARTLNNAHDVVFVGNYAAGPVVGTGEFGGQVVQQRTEAVIDASQSPRPQDGFVAWTVTGGVADFHPLMKASSEIIICTLWQIDGLSISENFVTD